MKIRGHACTSALPMCTNIANSPYAERMARDALKDEGIRGWFIDDSRSHLEGYDKVLTAGINGAFPGLTLMTR